MATEQATELCWALRADTLEDPRALQGIRKGNGLVSVYDVMRWVTGQPLNFCRATWQRILEFHPNMAGFCSSIKFAPKGRGRPGETPATDAAGIVQIIMVLPGRAADKFRQAASGVIVRYLGGDPGLVQEIWANRRYQEELAASQPEHPARVFGEAVEAEGLEAGASTQWQEQQLIEAQIALTRAQAKKADQETKLVALQCIALAEQMCCKLGFGFQTNGKYESMARAAVDAAMLPPGESRDGSLDAAQYLTLRGHTEQQIARLAGEFGKWLKLRRLSEGGSLGPTATQDHGSEEREVYLYSRQQDRELLASAYEAFKQRPLFQRVCPDDEGMQQRAAKDLQGSRGMRTKRRR